MKKRVLLLIMCVFAITAASAQATTMAVVGAGVGGWPDTDPLTADANQMTSTDGVNWIIEDLVVTGVDIKFRANNAWDSDGLTGFNIGGPATGSQFPSAIGVNSGSSANIAAGVIPGTYTVKLNTTTLAYSFEGGAVIPVVKLFGSAVDNGPIDMIASDADHFSVLVTLLTGDAQFNIDGIIASSGDFPAGGVLENGPAIPVVAGTYLVTYDNSIGEYSFDAPPIPTIAIVGAGVGGWPGDPGNVGPIDTNQMTTTDGGVTYTLNGLVVVGGEAKFRQNNAWSVNWGDSTASGNIELVAGTYDITFMPAATNSDGGTGLFTFKTAGTNDIVKTNDPAFLSTKGFSTASFKVYPNPTQNVWNFTSANEVIESVQIVNVLGKVVLSVSPKANVASVDASALNTGIYFAKIATAKASQTIKLMKN